MFVCTSTFITPASLNAADNNWKWDFDNPSDYSFNADYIDVTGATARLKAFPLEEGWWQGYSPAQNPDDLGITGGSSLTLDPSGNAILIASVKDDGDDPYDAWVEKRRGSDGAILWTSREDIGGWGLDNKCQAVICTTGGRVITAGYSEKPAAAGTELWIRRQDTTGLNPITVEFDLLKHVQCASLTCDKAGNILACGTTVDDPSPFGTEKMKAWVMKLDSNLVQIWQRIYAYTDPGADTFALSISADSSNSPVVAGYVAYGRPYPISTDIWVRKYTTGGDPVWAADTTISVDAFDMAISVDCWDRSPSGMTSDNRIFVGGLTGHMDGSDLIGEAFYARLDQNGTVSWQHTHTSAGYEEGRSFVAADYRGDLSVAAQHEDADRLLFGWVAKCDGQDGSTRFENTHALSPSPRSAYWTAFSVSDPAQPLELEDVAFAFTGSSIEGEITVRKYPMTKYSSLSPAISTSKRPLDTSEQAPTNFSMAFGAGNHGTVLFQLSNNLSTWYWHNGSAWKSTNWAGGPIWDACQANTVAEIDTNISTFDTGTNKALYVRVFLRGDGDQQVVLDWISCDSRPAEECHTWYFADGSTAWGFDEYVAVMNPNKRPALVEITYMLPNGDSDNLLARETAAPWLYPDKKLWVDPYSRATVHVDHLLDDVDLSLRLEARGEDEQHVGVVAERTLIKTVGGVPLQCGSVGAGTTRPSNTWYFAEGTIRDGFETYFCIQNPETTNANVTLDFMKGDGGSVSYTLDVPANSRKTVNARTDVSLSPGSEVARDFSCEVSSTSGIIVERSMSANDWQAFDGTLGTTAPATTWHFAEGCTNYGFETFLLVQNPGDAEAAGIATFFWSEPDPNDPCAPRVPKEYAQPFLVAPRSRVTIVPAQFIGPQEFSSRLDLSLPVVCERSMYWNSRRGLHAASGIAQARPYVYFAEGSTAKMNGFEEYLCIQNPNGVDIKVTITALTPCGPGGFLEFTVRKNTRTTIDIFNVVKDKENSLEVYCSDVVAYEFIAERSLYWRDETGAKRGGGVTTGYRSLPRIGDMPELSWKPPK
ncbi:MAG: hypothetical protein V1748_06955 [Actinomycetota bacterium]